MTEVRLPTTSCYYQCLGINDYAYRHSTSLSMICNLVSARRSLLRTISSSLWILARAERGDFRESYIAQRRLINCGTKKCQFHVIGERPDFPTMPNRYVTSTVRRTSSLYGCDDCSSDPQHGVSCSPRLSLPIKLAQSQETSAHAPQPLTPRSRLRTHAVAVLPAV